MSDPVARAAEAIEMMCRSDNPMPVGVAIDYVQDECEDRQEAVQCIYDAFARELYLILPDEVPHEHLTELWAVVGDIRCSWWDRITERVNSLRFHLQDNEDLMIWLSIAERTMLICVQVEEAGGNSVGH